MLKTNISNKSSIIIEDMISVNDGFLPEDNNSDARSYSSKLLSKLYKYSLSKNKFMKFLYSSRLHFILILEIIDSKKSYGKSFEYLCEKIDKQIGKRTTIQNILNQAISQGLIVKVPCEKDKRVKFYKLTEESKESLKKYMK